MCGRMALTLPMDAMAQLFAARPDNDLPDVPNYNVCPTTQVPAITSADGARRLQSMRWGLIPHWYKKPNGGPLLINARAETVMEKPAFKSSVHDRRALVVATGFFEWTKDAEGARDPWYIYRRDGKPLSFAALWRDWRDPETGTDTSTIALLTTGANQPMQKLHHRMPVIVEEPDWPLWLGEAGKGAATLMRAAKDDVLEWHRVDRAVNSNRAKGPELIEPSSEPQA